MKRQKSIHDWQETMRLCQERVVLDMKKIHGRRILGLAGRHLDDAFSRASSWMDVLVILTFNEDKSRSHKLAMEAFVLYLEYLDGTGVLDIMRKRKERLR